MVLTHGDYEKPLTLSADCVVVGSGAGGAPCAYLLAKEGLDVVLVEEGSFVTTPMFTQEPSRMIHTLYRDGGTSVIHGNPPIFFAEGRCVGGTTVINGGMCWRTPEEVVTAWEKVYGVKDISLKNLEPFFQEVEEIVSVLPQDQETLGKANLLFYEGAKKLKWEIIANRRNQIHCMGTNACILGCPTGAKQSTLVSYIPRALEKNLTLLANVRVEKILRKGGKACGVKGYQVSHLGKQGVPVTIYATVVVVSCGTIETPSLLYRSGYRNRWIGKNLLTHPNAKAIGIFPEPVRLWEGAHQAFQVREFISEGILLALAGVPPSFLAMALPFTGKEAADVMELYPYMIPGGTLVEDSVSGKLFLGPKRAIPFYQITDLDFYRLRKGTALAALLQLEAGAKAVILPFGKLPIIHSPDEIQKIFDPSLKKSDMELMTVHLMGTARMGGSPEISATNSYGKLWEDERVYVMDASLFPSPIGMNPQETIMVLSHRNTRFLLEEIYRLKAHSPRR